jgi:hypothetical protein
MTMIWRSIRAFLGAKKVTDAIDSEGFAAAIS